MISGAEVARFRTLLARRLGWSFNDSDLGQLDRVLHRRAAALGLSPSRYLGRAAADEHEAAALAEELTITETYFFRHTEQLRALAEEVLPARMAARSGQRVLRMLSVGCSSGEEAYTLAIAARQACPDPDWIVAVLGLDANPAMLRRAAEARYSTWALRETPDAIRARWFRPREGEYEVVPELRREVGFRRYNVADDDPELWLPGQYDVIFCRNLLMYLTPDTADTLTRRMTGALAPGGYLFLGHTDSLGSRPEGLEVRMGNGTFYYRRLESDVPPASRPAGDGEPRTPGPRVVPVQPPGDLENRVLGLLREERFADALRLLESDPPVRHPLLHGVLLAQAGRLDDAEMACRRLLDSDGLSADGHHLLGVCLEGGAAVDVAIGHYRLAAHLDPSFAMPRLRLGLLARRRGEDATTDLDRALRLLPQETDERIVLFGGGFGRIALSELCRGELADRGARR